MYAIRRYYASKLVPGQTSLTPTLYVADTGNNKIRIISSSTGETTTLAGSGSPGFDDGNGTAATFFSPEGITYDGSSSYNFV